MRLGVDVGGTKIEAIAIDKAGMARRRERVSTPIGDYEATIRSIAGLVEKVRAHADDDGQDLPGLGIGIPGAVSAATGLIKNANSTCLIGKSMAKDVHAATGFDVRLANDANCFAVSESVDGAGAGCAVVFGVILGTGIGGGVAINGQALNGHNHTRSICCLCPDRI